LVVGEGIDAQNKFEMDQKNWLDDLAKKRQLVEVFKSFTTPPAQAETVGAMVEQKMAMMKKEIMDEIGAKMEESNKEVKENSRFAA
jgi:hypothetical protein